ncbi:4-(cytidine 5'-diphospho)-2-C-methyl-D-erythritol kinase [Entomobacter blattae]|uniref:4-diphosphocytidyl-2-C-methyl-D-erythritol kinase n=1 Tax=Entomobacter blattae TaxID=2762277 RepID=A0A7H1NQ01_9PROT|nr:4-(cytidine 5'-diphospho)-2-C-methyl-D-erythritol kinase [Entomobacter blattae]QNT77861.1 4-diphosphocytidyl-2-C-methyl-D-erythritol kinase [Entomobacter blattae]
MSNHRFPPTSSSGSISEFARAKINLYLHITGKRPNGYHELDSLAVFAQVGDRLAISLNEKMASGVVSSSEAVLDSGPILRLTGPFAQNLAQVSGGDKRSNLVFKAARSLSQAVEEKTGQVFPIENLDITLEKNLPIASGIGGGSADAAAVIRALFILWKIDKLFSPQEILSCLKAIGADVPVCFQQKAVRMEGIGEILSEVPILPECGIVLVNPGRAVSTPLVFQARKGEFRKKVEYPPQWKNCEELISFLKGTSNDLQEAALLVEPVIRDVLESLAKLPQVRLVRMSGSGATCFALFEAKQEALEAIKRISHKEWWSWAGSLCI